jgi:gluconolactonase
MSRSFEMVNAARFQRYATSSALEELHSGMRWSEGPVWFADSQQLLFVDVPSSRIHRWAEGQGVSTMRSPSNYANGMTRDREGRLITCEHETRRVTRTELDGSITVIADRYQGRRLNSPNDVVVKSDGTVWFSDPDYGILSDYSGVKAESEIGACNVYRWDPRSHQLAIAGAGFSKPNGLAFSPDERHLYVADSGRTHDANAPHAIYRFDVSADGNLTSKALFFEVERGVPDGLRVDVDGNIWTSSVSDEGVLCITPEGELIGRIRVPEPVSNVCFGGPKMNRLFITAESKLYSVFVGVRGLSCV